MRVARNISTAAPAAEVADSIELSSVCAARAEEAFALGLLTQRRVLLRRERLRAPALLRDTSGLLFGKVLDEVGVMCSVSMLDARNGGRHC